MKELMIYEFQAKQIENTLRLVANAFGCRKKETCLDRQVCKSIEMIKEVLSKTLPVLENAKPEKVITNPKNPLIP